METKASVKPVDVHHYIGKSVSLCSQQLSVIIPTFYTYLYNTSTIDVSIVLCIVRICLLVLFHCSIHQHTQIYCLFKNWSAYVIIVACCVSNDSTATRLNLKEIRGNHFIFINFDNELSHLDLEEQLTTKCSFILRSIPLRNAFSAKSNAAI